MKLNKEQTKFQKQATSFLMNAFTFFKIPSAFFSGVRVNNLDEKNCVVTVPYKWFATNPFRSTYFACLSMAAELSTGLPTMWATKGYKPSFSMLVIDMKSEFVKKATSTTFFTCENIQDIFQAVDECIKTQESRAIKMKSIGKDKDGEIIAHFEFTWSIKQRSFK
ncbi:MAG: DUF4442 domain-containing protein [Bacteriovoracaceae bacterium]|nr:DUF4442 domain-containing protein [Bacteriovoracaceae bacterium]